MSRRTFVCILALLLFCAGLLPRSAAAAGRPFHIGVFGGLSAGGELYTASTMDPDHIWTSPEGEHFGGERVKASLDENFIFGLRVGKGISEQFSWNVSLAYTSMNISADVLTTARNADTYNYDQVNATFIDAVVNWFWSKEKNAPYFLAGLGYASLGFMERGDAAYDLDQSGIEYLLGGGYRWGIVQIEARDHLVPTDFGPEAARLGVDEFNGKDLVQFWEIGLGVVFDF